MDGNERGDWRLLRCSVRCLGVRSGTPHAKRGAVPPAAPSSLPLYYLRVPNLVDSIGIYMTRFLKYHEKYPV